MSSKVYVEILGSESQRQALRAELEAVPPSASWSIDTDAQRKYAERRTSVQPPPTAVEFDADIPPRALVWLHWKRDMAVVTNITPRDKRSLTAAEYNRIAELFVDRVLRCTPTGKTLEIHLSRDRPR